MNRILSIWSASLVIGVLFETYKTLPEYNSSDGSVLFMATLIEPLVCPLMGSFVANVPFTLLT
jgi:hypothetical protein